MAASQGEQKVDIKTIIQKSILYFQRLSGLEWTPPKGRIDAGEDTMEAAFREAREEAGLEADMMTVYNDTQGQVSYSVVGWPKTVTLWLARLNDPNQEIKLSDENPKYKWLVLAEAKKISPKLTPVLDEFSEAMKKFPINLNA